ncbi:MAG: membrane dipeptidase [Candidatus Zixiibacteriota bacterium]|nr:MAG: membrane dipeptidase [candidate division Zixibacteria bacterium]
MSCSKSIDAHEGLDDCSMLSNSNKQLAARGYSAEDIKNVRGENFMRICRRVCGE